VRGGHGRGRQQARRLGACLGALHGEHRELGALTNLDAEPGGLLAHPREVLVARAGVDDRAEGGLAEKIDDEIVDDAGRLIEHAAVERLARQLQLADVVGEEPEEKRPDAGALEIDDAHVRDVEDTGAAAHRVMLGNLGAVLQRHVPAAEIHHPGAKLVVQFE
jgi:hypothetical protein